MANQSLRYQFHRVPRRRHIHLLVDDDGALHVRAPLRCSAGDAERMIRDNQIWVLRNLAGAKHRLALRPRLCSGAILPLLDERLKLIVNPVVQADLFDATAALDTNDICRRGSELHVRLARDSEECLKSSLEGWYRECAKCVLPARVERFSKLLSVRPNRVTIRGQKTCWGSCSGRGNISLNWRLMLVPAPLADYVVVHELCHLRFLDHSRGFWRFVETFVPDYRRKRQALRAAQTTLVL